MGGLEYFKIKMVNFIHLIIRLKYNFYRYIKKAIEIKMGNSMDMDTKITKVILWKGYSKMVN